MALMPTGFVHQQEIKSAIERVQSKFAQDVDHINYSFGENWTGEPSIFFRVVLREEGIPMDRLGELAERVSIFLMNEARTDEIGLHAYFDFRSVAEQAKLQDPAWA
jgi:hypothetical protein